MAHTYYLWTRFRYMFSQWIIYLVWSVCNKQFRTLLHSASHAHLLDTAELYLESIASVHNTKSADCGPTGLYLESIASVDNIIW